MKPPNNLLNKQIHCIKVIIFCETTQNIPAVILQLQSGILNALRASYLKKRFMPPNTLADDIEQVTTTNVPNFCTDPKLQSATAVS